MSAERAAADALEAAATTLDDLALAMVTSGEDNPEGTAITAGIVQKCAAIVRQHKERMTK